MKIKHSIALSVFAVCVLAVLGVLAFAAGGIVARYNINPLVVIVDAAEANVKTLVKSLKGESRNEEYFTSAYYHLKTTTYKTSTDDRGDSVAFAPLADGYLVGTRGGELKFAQMDGSNQLSVRTLTQVVPTNKAEFLADSEGFNYRLHIQFGAKDIFVQPLGDRLRLYATHHYWHEEKQCAVLRLSVLETTIEAMLWESSGGTGAWRTLFDTEPCMDLDNKLNHYNEDDALLQAGGRLALLDDDHLLMTVGDHFFDAVHNTDLVQDKTSSYGKVMLINLSDKSARMYSFGHRNPQGLYVDREGNIWLTEHGPRGGDELNLVEPGNNYGWPMVNYGTDYLKVDWPEHLDWGGHEGYEQPVLAWYPSIAVSNLIRLEDSAFSRWEGHLIVGSLKDQAIHRLVLVGDRVVLSERISMGSRIRDLMQTEDGKLLLLTDEGNLIAMEALNDNDPNQPLPPELRAAQLWVNCDSCHTLESGAGHSIGPNLKGVVGSDIARFDDYSYSRALAGLEGNWTPEKLDEFLRDPQAFAPGNAMGFSGFEDSSDRQAIIDYLQAH